MGRKAECFATLPPSQPVGDRGREGSDPGWRTRFLAVALPAPNACYSALCAERHLRSSAPLGAAHPPPAGDPRKGFQDSPKRTAEPGRAPLFGVVERIHVRVPHAVIV